MGLKVGDNLSWKYEVRNGEIVTTIRKVKTSIRNFEICVNNTIIMMQKEQAMQFIYIILGPI
jgi:hypothetical protein